MKVLISVFTLVLLVLLGACAPSPEQAETMTAAARTPTPAPTPTATPIPYDLIIHVHDASGQPIPGASVVIPESGSEQAKQADASGTLVWKALPGPEANLNVSSPGYYSALQPVSLNPGQTELVVILLANSFALMPANACAGNERLLYSEDFEDRQAQGWPQITAAVDDHAQNGWSIRAEADGNQAASVTGIHESLDALRGYTFDNVVWRLKVMILEHDGYSILDFRQAQAAGTETRYTVKWGGAPFMDLVHVQTPDTGSNAGKVSTLRMQSSRWYYLEISAYQGVIQVWVDGKKLISFTDPNPLPPGTIGLEAHVLKDAKTAYYFDDLSVCGLSAPFSASLYKPPAQ